MAVGGKSQTRRPRPWMTEAEETEHHRSLVPVALELLFLKRGLFLKTSPWSIGAC